MYKIVIVIMTVIMLTDIECKIIKNNFTYRIYINIKTYLLKNIF